jgi:hypothetical protein
MTNLLMEVVRKVSELPMERQNDAAHILMAMLDNDARRFRFTDEDLQEIDLAIAEADAGQFASEEDVEALLHRSWA